MPKTASYSHIPTVLLTVVLVLWLVSASFFLLLLPPVTHYWATQTVDAADSTLSSTQLVNNADLGRAYVAGSKTAQLPTGSDERTSYPPDVVSHLDSVRSLFVTIKYLAAASTLVILLALLWVWRRRRARQLGNAALAAAIFTVVFCLVCAVLAWQNFDAFFTWVHSLFFAAGTWEFSYDSLLICTYPLQFWMFMGITWAVILVLLCLILIIIGSGLRRTAPRRPKKSER
ncbi:MAG: DUF1461 domain-containing protein [Coriobacteriia bacterium]|nr:DUF1461 domain-containing protein [Coriobacteriia bacterium]